MGFAPGVNAEPRAYETRDEEPPPASQEQPPPTTTGQSGVAPSTAAPSKQKRPSKREDYPPAIEPRRGGSNYFMVGLYDSTDKDAHLVKFQVDLEYDVMRLEHWPKVGAFYLTAPIQFLSFWDLFDTLDGAKSSPFVETDYAVGGEVAWVAPFKRFWMLRSGMLHQSNGLGFLAGSTQQLLQSRSWNRVYLETIHEALSTDWMRIEIALAGWFPFASDEIVQWDNGERG
ncbi:MAG TPA: phospholipase A, partial [Polyangiaceae bacterium]|nr:phospholipase A [Polyangiaceae bacterium]